MEEVTLLMFYIYKFRCILLFNIPKRVLICQEHLAQLGGAHIIATTRLWF